MRLPWLVINKLYEMTGKWKVRKTDEVHTPKITGKRVQIVGTTMANKHVKRMLRSQFILCFIRNDREIQATTTHRLDYIFRGSEYVWNAFNCTTPSVWFVFVFNMRAHMIMMLPEEKSGTKKAHRQHFNAFQTTVDKWIRFFFPCAGHRRVICARLNHANEHFHWKRCAIPSSLFVAVCTTNSPAFNHICSSNGKKPLRERERRKNLLSTHRKW